MALCEAGRVQVRILRGTRDTLKISGEIGVTTTVPVVVPIRVELPEVDKAGGAGIVAAKDANERHNAHNDINIDFIELLGIK